MPVTGPRIIKFYNDDALKEFSKHSTTYDGYAFQCMAASPKFGNVTDAVSHYTMNIVSNFIKFENLHWDLKFADKEDVLDKKHLLVEYAGNVFQNIACLCKLLKMDIYSICDMTNKELFKTHSPVRSWEWPTRQVREAVLGLVDKANSILLGNPITEYSPIVLLLVTLFKQCAAHALKVHNPSLAYGEIMIVVIDKSLEKMKSTSSNKPVIKLKEKEQTNV